MSTQLPLFSESELTPITELEVVRQTALTCQRCKLASFRKKVVFGKGNVNRPPIMFIGEAPGANEDEIGEPFVGRAGKLLTKLLQIIGLNREEVYISNCVKCRPPGNRVPEPQELAACATYIVREINSIQPRTICLLGMTAAKTIIGTRVKSLSSLRGKPYTWRDIPVRVTYHPAYLLRSPHKEGEAVDDLKLIRTIIARNTST